MSALDVQDLELAGEDWLAWNQRALVAELEEVRRLLTGEPPGLPAEAGPPGGSALDTVCSCFALSSFERRIVVACAGPELDGRFGGVIAKASGDGSRAGLTFGQCLAAFPDAHWSALAPDGPLRSWRLVEPGPGLLTSASLRIDEWLLHVLTGIGSLDRRLTCLAAPLDSPAPVPASFEGAVAALVAAWSRPAGAIPAVLRGPSRHARRAVFGEACRRGERRGYVVAGGDLPGGAAEQDELVRLWQRQARLEGLALLVESGREADPVQLGALDRFVDHCAGALAVSSADGRRVGTGPCLLVDTAKPTAGEQRALWLAALGSAGLEAELDGTIGRVVEQFDLDADAIGLAATALQCVPANRAAPGATAAGGAVAGIAAARGAAGSAATGGTSEALSADATAGQTLWEVCRRSTRGGLDDLAQRVESRAGFADLVLPEQQRSQLEEMILRARHRSLVYGTWGMSGHSGRGLGVGALFAGPSGTGKTLAAEVLANELALDLYRIDLSQVVSKYIGETEKNLRRVFEAATDSGAVLLFDEADALFGRRSEVRDSHDRYANVEVSYLLQAMESYRGLAVLTTNQRAALDPAFLRRLGFVISFPFPGPAERARIWERAFPPSTPTDGLQFARLSQLAVAGGNIRNIAVHAAFSAAGAGVAVSMRQVLHAAVAEYAKLERPLTDAEVLGWT